MHIFFFSRRIDLAIRKLNVHSLAYVKGAVWMENRFFFSQNKYFELLLTNNLICEKKRKKVPIDFEKQFALKRVWNAKNNNLYPDNVLKKMTKNGQHKIILG